ncbi:MAG: HAMP domain-containing sensor histidine kinase [Thiolinea sp.]
MPINAHLPLPGRARLSLRTILLIVMLTILLLPLLGLYFFRIYENELVRQTELELISQSAALAATYRQYARRIHPDLDNYGYIIHSSPLIPNSRGDYLNSKQASSPYTPITPALDLVNPVQPPRANAVAPTTLPDETSRRIAFEMKPVMRDTQIVTLVGVRLLDMNGVVIGGREEIGLSLAHVTEVKQALRGHYASVIRQRLSDEPPPPLYSISRGTNIRVFTAFPVIEKNRLLGVIYLSRTPKNIIKHLYLVQDKLYLATVTLLLVAVLMVLFVSSSISRPIRELIEQIKRVTRGEQTQVVPIKHPVSHEVAQLSESFARMSRTLAERSDYINRFATHVSHEFKTPLTSMQGALELLQEHIDTMPTEKRHRFMANLLEDTQRLKNLVSRLLELARADSLEPSNTHSSLPEQLRRLENRYKERGLVLVYDELPEQELAIAPDALETILNNLLENSLQHGASEVTLSTEAEESGTYLLLKLHDNGSGISPANRDKIFTPFFTTKRNAGGTGLGLEIIASLLKTYNGQIFLGDQEEGAAFILSIPYSVKT